MIVLLPTHQLDAMRAWDGIPVCWRTYQLWGTGMANVINWLALRQLGLCMAQYLGAVRGGAGTGGSPPAASCVKLALTFKPS